MTPRSATISVEQSLRVCISSAKKKKQKQKTKKKNEEAKIPQGRRNKQKLKLLSASDSATSIIRKKLSQKRLKVLLVLIKSKLYCTCNMFATFPTPFRFSTILLTNSNTILSPNSIPRA